eukprot:SM000059S18710  [mRNA]  locus=s59:523021:525824:- [translate_table: standard]
MLLVSSADSSVRVWDARDDQPVQALLGERGDEFWCCAAAGSLVAAGANAKIRCWDTRTRKCIACLEECHTEAVTQVAFHPVHRSRLFSASIDGLMCVFDTSGTINDDEGLEVVMNTGTSIARIGFFGTASQNLWCTTHIETLSLWSLADMERVADFPDARNQLSGCWSLAPVDYLVCCEFSESLDSLNVIAGTQDGDVGYFPVTPAMPGRGDSGPVSCAALAPAAAVLQGGHAATVRAVVPASGRSLACWTGGEDGRLCGWAADSKGKPAAPPPPRRRAVMHEDRQKGRHSPY